MLGVEGLALFSMERNAALRFLLLFLYVGFAVSAEQMIATVDGRSVAECVSTNCWWSSVRVLNVVVWSSVLCGSGFDCSLECRDMVLIFFSGLKTAGANTEMNYFEAYSALKM